MSTFPMTTAAQAAQLLADARARHRACCEPEPAGPDAMTPAEQAPVAATTVRH